MDWLDNINNTYGKTQGVWKKYSEIAGRMLLLFGSVAHEIWNQGQLVCFAGYDVVENQSGNSLGEMYIKKATAISEGYSTCFPMRNQERGGTFCQP